jgi:hypothetical protein
MSVYYQNSRGLKTKTNSFYNNLLNSEYSIICLTETWLQDAISSNEIFDSRYTVIRADRNLKTTHKSDGGGVLIALLKTYFKNFHTNISWLTPSVEMTCVSATLQNNELIHIFCIYLEPKYSLTKLELLLTNLERICIENSEDNFLIVGDWNVPEFVSYNQASNCAPDSVNLELSKCRLLFDFMNVCNLNQLNHIKNHNGRLLDLIISNINIQIELCDSPISPADNHHPPLMGDLVANCGEVTHTAFRNYKKSDYININTIFCNIDWLSLFNNNESVSGCVDTFYNITKIIINEFTPLESIKPRNFPPWFSRNTIYLLNQKRKYHKRWKSFRNPYDYNRFSSLRTKCKSSIESDHSSYTYKCENSIISSPKRFWSYVDSKKNNASDIPRTVMWDNERSNNFQEASEIFANYFESVYSNETFKPPNIQDFYGLDVHSMAISYDEVYEELLRLKDDCSCGPDGIPPIILKNCAFSLTFPLTILFNISLQTGVFPLAWKTSYVTPVFKSGGKNLAVNYRPICKNCTAAQVFDSIVTKKLTLKFNNIIAIQQHGFCKGKSTLTNLLGFTENIFQAFDEKCQLDSIYTDFSKAFDSVNHSALVYKLACSGINGDLLRWLNSYLQNRTLIVRLSRCISRPFHATSGVPQGSHLGPLLFLLFINDLSWLIGDRVDISIFADDLKIFRKVENLNDVDILQKSLNALSAYCSQFHLQLNINKCFHITFSRQISNPIQSSFNLTGIPLSKVDSIKDLGVCLDSKLTFNTHMKHCYNKALKMLGFLFRTCRDFRNVQSLKIVYFSYVRSHLEYCCQVWNPTKVSCSAILEKIQKKFVRFLFFRNLVPDNPSHNNTNFGCNSFSYSSCLRNLHLQSLRDRREFFDIDLVLKVFTHQIDSSSFMHFFGFPEELRELRHRRSFQTSITKKSSIDRCMNAFNDLKMNLNALSLGSYSYARSKTLSSLKKKAII